MQLNHQDLLPPQFFHQKYTLRRLQSRLHGLLVVQGCIQYSREMSKHWPLGHSTKHH